jgi:hypothetical protein
MIDLLDKTGPMAWHSPDRDMTGNWYWLTKRFKFSLALS